MGGCAGRFVGMSREYVLQAFRAPVRLQIDYAGELNQQQYAAATAPPGPSLVIAGAGSGKTRTLTYRVAYLLEHGIAAERIVLLTFTNKAAREMMRRVSDLLGCELKDLWGGTFHSVANRVLRMHANLVGFERDFSIMDREDARHLLTTCIAEAGIDVKETRFPKADVLGDIYSLAVNTQKSVGEILARQYRHFDHLAESVKRVQEVYATHKRGCNAMDFDDLLEYWLRLMREQPEVREQYQRKFEFVLVDEYQDTNKLQGDIIDVLAERRRNLMVVGDDSQSIYAWRGANFQNILEFPVRYPDAKVYKIEMNYRSTPEILGVANAAIMANARQFRKELTPARKPGMKPAVVACADSHQQAEFVAQRVLELRDEGMDLNGMAVLYRSHFHALELQLELTRRNIPFTITSGIRFFEQAHIKDVIAHIKLVMNPRDELAFKRLVLMLPGIGGKGAEKLWKCFETASVEVLASGAAPAVATALQRCESLLRAGSRVAWAQFSATVAQLEQERTKENASGLIALVLEAGYDKYLEENFANHKSRLEDLQQLAVFARQFHEIQEFLSQLALLTNLEAEEEKPADKDEEQIKLSTIHQAKGLEFDVVFVIMLCDGMFPSERSLETADGEEEERRLMYVAVTRARTELYLCYPVVRDTYGGYGQQAPSRFLGEIPEELVESWGVKKF